MTQVQQTLVSTLASLSEFHERLTDFSRRLLREYDFDSDVELTHQILIESIKESVRFKSLHRFTISVGPDFANCREIDIAAEILFGESSCTTSAAIRAHPYEAAGEVGEQKITLHEEIDDGIDLRDSIEFLRKAVGNLGNLTDPLNPLATRYV